MENSWGSKWILLGSWRGSSPQCLCFQTSFLRVHKHRYKNIRTSRPQPHHWTKFDRNIPDILHWTAQMEHMGLTGEVRHLWWEPADCCQSQHSPLSCHPQRPGSRGEMWFLRATASWRASTPLETKKHQEREHMETEGKQNVCLLAFSGTGSHLPFWLWTKETRGGRI